MSTKYMTKAEFARHCEVTPTAIHAAVKDGRVKLSHNGMVDAYGVNNKRYRKIQVDRKRRTAKGRSELKLKAERGSENRQNPRRSEVNSGDLPHVEKALEGYDPPSKKRLEAFDQDAAQNEIDYAIEKMRSATALNKARLAEMVRATIRRDFVDEVISLIGTSISDHLVTMGDRLSADLAALAGSTEAAVVRQIKEGIDTDVSASLEEMKRVVRRQYEERLVE